MAAPAEDSVRSKLLQTDVGVYLLAANDVEETLVDDVVGCGYKSIQRLWNALKKSDVETFLTRILSEVKTVKKDQDYLWRSGERDALVESLGKLLDTKEDGLDELVRAAKKKLFGAVLRGMEKGRN